MFCPWIHCPLPYLLIQCMRRFFGEASSSTDTREWNTPLRRLRAGGQDEYRHLGDLPYPWPKKLRRLGTILDLPGPLQPHATAIRNALIPLTGAERHRHLLVHGMMSLDVRKDNPRMLFLKTHDRIAKNLGEITLWITIEELVELTQGMAPYVQTFTQLVAALFRHLDLQPIETADLQELETGVRHF